MDNEIIMTAFYWVLKVGTVVLFMAAIKSTILFIMQLVRFHGLMLLDRDASVQPIYASMVTWSWTLFFILYHFIK